MSLTNFPDEGKPAAAPTSQLTTKVTMPALAEMKREGKPITALTAYDYATSRLVDEAGIDLILVGDSLAMVVLGHDNTWPSPWTRCCTTRARCGGRCGGRWWWPICRSAAITASF
jgi:hypothetical protein